MKAILSTIIDSLKHTLVGFTVTSGCLSATQGVLKGFVRCN